MLGTSLMVEIIGGGLLSSCSIRVIGHERPSHETLVKPVHGSMAMLP